MHDINVINAFPHRIARRNMTGSLEGFLHIVNLKDEHRSLPTFEKDDLEALFEFGRHRPIFLWRGL